VQLQIIQYQKLETVGEKESNMTKLLVLIDLCYFILFPCLSQNINSIRGTFWLNVDYISDMESYLPCECADSTNEWVSIKFTEEDEYDSNTKFPEVRLNRILQNEPSLFYIISETEVGYVISEDNIKCLKFVNNSNLINYNSIDNIALLNRALAKQGYPSITTILKTDSLELVCAPSWGNINLVYSYGKRNLYWVLEIFDGYLHIYKVINPMRDPLDPVLKKEIRRLKWVTKRKERKPHREEYPIFISPK